MIGVKHALVDLAKDRNGVAGIGWKHEGGVILDWPLERQFGTRKYADSHRTIYRRGESSCAGAEVVCDEFFAHFGWACSHAVQTVVAHIKELLSWKPPDSTTLTENTPHRSASIANRCRWPLAAYRRSMHERRAARVPLLAGGPPGERNGQYRRGERTKAAIAERQKFSALLKMLRTDLT